jgi:hypothetical protein
MIRLRHKLLIQMFRVFDQLILVLTGILIIYFRPEIALRGDTHILEATIKIEDAFGMLFLAVGWIGIFDYFIRYKVGPPRRSQHPVEEPAQGHQPRHVLADGDQRRLHGEELQSAQHPVVLPNRHEHRDRQPAVPPRVAAQRPEIRIQLPLPAGGGRQRTLQRRWSARSR